jgi:hypothetical protein
MGQMVFFRQIGMPSLFLKGMVVGSADYSIG